MSAPGNTIMSSQAEYLREQTPPKITPPRFPEIPQGYMYVQDVESLKARCDELAREWRLFHAPAVYRGRTLVFGMSKPREWNSLSPTDRTKLKRAHLVRQCGKENVWFEEDQFPRLDQPIVAFHADYHAQFEVEDVPNSREQYADTSILIRSLRSEDLESFTADESDLLAAAKFSRLLAYGRYEDWKKLLAIQIQREEAAKEAYERYLARRQEEEKENARFRGLAALEARRQMAEKERERALQAQKADEDQRIRLLQEREAEELAKQKQRAFLERRHQEREQARRQLTQFQPLEQLNTPAAPHPTMSHSPSSQPLSQQQRKQPQTRASQSAEQQRAAILLQIMRDNSIARDTLSHHQYNNSARPPPQSTRSQTPPTPTHTLPASFPPPSVRHSIPSSPAHQTSPPQDSSFAQLFKPESRKRPASSMSNSSHTDSWGGIAKYHRGQSLERGQTANSPEFAGNAGFDMSVLTTPRSIDPSQIAAPVRTTQSRITRNSNNALLFASPSTLLETKMHNQPSLTPLHLTTKRPPTRFTGHDEHRYCASSHNPPNPTPKRRRLCESYRTSSISIEMARYYQKMIEKLVQIMKLHFAWAYLQVPTTILDHIAVKTSVDWIANRLQIGDYGAARYATVAEAVKNFLIMDFNRKFEFVVEQNIRAGIQGDLSANLMKTKNMQSRALDMATGQWEQLVTNLMHPNVST